MTKLEIKPNEILPLFDSFLAKHKESFDAVIIGGGALSIMGIIPRMTADFDVLDPDIPKAILDLAEQFRAESSHQGIRLEKDWLNNGPVELRLRLPSAWRERVITIYQGKAIVFHTLSRSDMLKTKLDTCCVRVQPDLNDILHLKPTKEELLNASEWVLEQDAADEWPRIVREATKYIARKLGYEL